MIGCGKVDLTLDVPNELVNSLVVFDELKNESSLLNTLIGI